MSKAILIHRRPRLSRETHHRVTKKRRGAFANNKVTLTRLGAPLLYAYDANTLFRRIRGLSAVPPLGPVDALIVRSSKFCQTFALRETIDVIFLNFEGDIMKVASMPPKSAMFCRKSHIVIKMAHGTAKRLSLAVGHRFLPEDERW